MKQYNYAVDLSNYTEEVRTAINDMLEDVAIEYSWLRLDWFDNDKKYFRFKLIVDPSEINSNNTYDKHDPGFYFWTANSMKDNDYQLISINEGINLLTRIDKSIIEHLKISNVIVEKKNTTTIRIGCREVKISDIKTILDLKNRYGIPQIDFKTQGVTFTIDRDAEIKLEKLINKKG